MPLSVINKLLCTTQDEILDAVKDCAVAAGWTLHDTTATGYCLSSQGESGDHYPMYLYMYKFDATIIYTFAYLGWNLTTQAGLGGRLGNQPYQRIDCNSSGGTYLWMSANKDSLAVGVYVGTRFALNLTIIATTIIELPALGVLQSDVAAGSSVVLQLASGEADRFIAGNNYQILGLSGTTTNRNLVTVEAVDTTLHQLTITTLAYAFKATSRIGHLPHPWILSGGQTTQGSSNITSYPWSTNGTANVAGTAGATYINTPFSVTHVDPDLRSGKFILQPYLFGDYLGAGPIGWATVNTTFCRLYIDTSSEHTVAVGEHDFGTSSGSNTGTTLNDTTKSWTTNEFTDKVLIITAGTGQGQFRKIASNTATEITITAAFTTTPDDTSQYSIADEGWLYLYFGTTSTLSGCLRMI